MDKFRVVYTLTFFSTVVAGKRWITSPVLALLVTPVASSAPNPPIPLSQRGGDELDNLVLLHPTCHQQLHNPHSDIELPPS